MKYKSFFLFIISLVANLRLISYLDYRFTSEYSNEEVPEADIIFTYKADFLYGDLNEIYVTGSGINIEEAYKDRLIRYEDIPLIAEMEGVHKVIALDNYFFDQLIKTFTEEGVFDEFIVISVPNFINKDNNLVNYAFGMREVKEGRLPKDFRNEIALSKKQLIEFFDYTPEMASDPIGDKITFNGILYTIVGLTYNEIAHISYDEENNYGFYQYNPFDFDDFMGRNVNYKLGLEFFCPFETDELLIYTEVGMEEVVLNQLFQMFPAENYYSNRYVEVWIKSFNRSMLPINLLINLVLITLLSLGLFIISRILLKTPPSLASIVVRYVAILILTLVSSIHFPFKSIIVLNTFILMYPHLLYRSRVIKESS